MFIKDVQVGHTYDLGPRGTGGSLTRFIVEVKTVGPFTTAITGWMGGFRTTFAYPNLTTVTEIE